MTNEYRLWWKDSPAQWTLILLLCAWVIVWALFSLATGTAGHLTARGEVPPVVSGVSPSNGSTAVPIFPWCHIDLSDADGDLMDVHWYDNSSGSWVASQVNWSVANGTYWWCYVGASVLNTTYGWGVFIYDGHGTIWKTYYFTTGVPSGNVPPVITNASPANGSTWMPLWVWCHIDISDPDGDLMVINWWENSTGSWVLRSTNASVPNGTYWWEDNYGVYYGTVYYWQAVVTDATHAAYVLYHFTTRSNLPPVVSNPLPANGSVGQVRQPLCSINISDPEGDPISVAWYDTAAGSLVLRQTSSGLSNGTASWQYLFAMAYSTTYTWMVAVSDGNSTVIRVYHFTIEPAPTPPPPPPSPPPPDTRPPDERPGDGTVVIMKYPARCPEDVAMDGNGTCPDLDPFAITRATERTALYNVTTGFLPIAFPNRTYCTYDILSDQLYIAGNFSTHIIIRYANGTLRWDVWTNPGVLDLVDGLNVTFISSSRCSWVRVTTWREYWPFLWAYTPAERKYVLTIALNNTQAVNWSDVRWFVGWPKNSAIDTQGIFVEDLNNGVVLWRGENYDVSFGGVSMAFKTINSSLSRTFRITAWDVNATQTLSPPLIICLNEIIDRYNDQPYYSVSGSWTNDYALPYHGTAFIKIMADHSVDPGTVVVYDVARSQELDPTLFSVAGSTVILDSDAVGTVPVGGVLDYKVFYKAPLQDQGLTLFSPLFKIGPLVLSLYWIAFACAVAAVVVSAKRLKHDDAVIMGTVVFSLFVIIGLLHMKGVI